LPYYIYRVMPFAQLEKLTEHPVFATASSEAKALRAAQPANAPGKIKVIFADNELQAEDLLCQVRDPAPLGDE
jgi:hypothetical protein